jgi:hypothetical protein
LLQSAQKQALGAALALVELSFGMPSMFGNVCS